MPRAKTLPELKKFSARNQEQARQKIKITKLIQRMQDFAMAECHVVENIDDNGKVQQTHEFRDEKGKTVYPMTKEQITAASKVIDKALPNITKLESEHTENKVHSISGDTLDAIAQLTHQASEKADFIDITEKAEIIGLNEPQEDLGLSEESLGLNEPEQD